MIIRTAILITSSFWLATSARAAEQGSAPARVAAASPKVALRVETPKFAGFLVGASRCDASLRNVTVPLSGEVDLPANYADGTKLNYDIAVNGARQQATTAPILKRENGSPYTRIVRELTLSTSRVDAQVRLFIGATAVGTVQTVPTACLQAKANVAVQGKISWPDLAIGPVVIADYDPPRPTFTPRAACGICAPRLELPQDWGGFAQYRTIIATDLRRTLDLTRILGTACPASGDAFVTVRFWVSILAKGVDPSPFFAHEKTIIFVTDHPDQRTTEPALYFDTRAASPQVPDGYTTIPQGYEWAVFDRTLSCASDGIFEFTIDPENKQREENESNNHVGVRYHITRK